jgi:hypothetical protein
VRRVLKLEFKKLIDYVEDNKKEYLEKELTENRRKLRGKLIQHSIEENYEALKRLND